MVALQRYYMTCIVFSPTTGIFCFFVLLYINRFPFAVPTARCTEVFDQQRNVGSFRLVSNGITRLVDRFHNGIIPNMIFQSDDVILIEYSERLPDVSCKIARQSPSLSHAN